MPSEMSKALFLLRLLLGALRVYFAVIYFHLRAVVALLLFLFVYAID
jgi:hypothetical protein